MSNQLLIDQPESEQTEVKFELKFEQDRDHALEIFLVSTIVLTLIYFWRF